MASPSEDPEGGMEDRVGAMVERALGRCLPTLLAKLKEAGQGSASGDTPSGSLADTIPPGRDLEGVETVTPGSERREALSGLAALGSTISMMPTLPPAATAERGATRQASVYIGEGLPPVPGRLAERIRRWEFIEMHELLPELLANQKVEEGLDKQGGRAKGKKRILDISTWLQCYAVFVGMVAKDSPEAVPGLMAYMVGIIRASQEYEGAAWVAYDTAFRRQAAATDQREWAKINTSLYTICFTGKARKAKRCDVCLSATHTTTDCYIGDDDDPDMSRRVKAVESAMVAFSSNPQGSNLRAMRSGELCRLFNGKGCRFRNCKYRHACKWCDGSHAGVDCRARPEPGKQEHGPGPMRREVNPHSPAWRAGPPY